MKVALFCGGLGTRLRDYSDTVPKPLVNIGNRPIIWHLMKYYSHFGHHDFVLCLGYMGIMIKEYFLKYEEWVSNDFVLSNKGKDVELFNRDIDEWKISFLETGANSNIGTRLKKVQSYLQNEDIFMANYSDGLSNVPLDDYLEKFIKDDVVASFVAVRPSSSFHAVSTDKNGLVTDINNLSKSELWLNGGFFIFRKEIFDYMNEGEELVEQPFQRLIKEKLLMSYRHDGFWKAMDTYKDKIEFEKMYTDGNRLWEMWNK